MSEWKPIETAPTLKKVQFLRNERVFTGWYNPDCQDPEFPYHFIDETCLDGLNAFSSNYPPSHWRDLNEEVGEPPK